MTSEIAVSLAAGKRAAQAAISAGGGFLKLVVGNESCDLDSVVSSVVYADYLAARTRNGPASMLPVPVAVMNVPRKDFVLRNDIVWLLNECGIQWEELTFADDPEVTGLPTSAVSEVVLVDHNVITPSFEQWADRVTEIIDHHSDAGKHENTPLRIIEKVGSCASLITRTIGMTKLTFTPATARLLFGPIVADTIGLDESKGRCFSKDLAAADVLLNVSPELDSTRMFDKLTEAKNDVSALTTAQVLRKDYKQRQAGGFSVGVASVPGSLVSMAQTRPDFKMAVSKFKSDHCLDLFCLMGTTFKPSFGRELAVIATNPEICLSVCDFVETTEQALDLTILTIDSTNWPGGARVYSQGAIGKSRKFVLPALVAFLENLS